MRTQHLLVTIVVLSCIKLLLIPCYRSTDFDVHRNWLAITHSLPIDKWYFDNTSIWTLDYPPFFAYFEWVLSQFAVFVDPNMLRVDLVDYASDATIYFQRISVICIDAILIVASWFFVGGNMNYNPSMDKLRSFHLAVTNSALLLVDHVHFQYNGMLLGVLILALYFAKHEKLLHFAACAAVLMFLKHLFLPLAPLFAIYLLRRHVFESDRFSFMAFMQLVTIALIVLFLAFGPFLVQSNGMEQIHQILTRLFPFGRGLLHTYWAPNVWALYCFLDMILVKLLGISGKGVSMSSGIQGIFEPSILADVPASICMILVVASILPVLKIMWLAPSWQVLSKATVYCSLSVFMLGYHVHEKALLIPTVILALMSSDSPNDAHLYVMLSMVCTHAQLPLFPNISELALKLFLFVSYAIMTVSLLGDEVIPKKRKEWRVLLVLHGMMITFREILHPVATVGLFGTGLQRFAVKYEFIPLMLTSIFNAVLLLPCWRQALENVYECDRQYADRNDETWRDVPGDGEEYHDIGLSDGDGNGQYSSDRPRSALRKRFSNRSKKSVSFSPESDLVR
jgi:alpha-1,3-glucosyltransferase